MALQTNLLYRDTQSNTPHQKQQIKQDRQMKRIGLTFLISYNFYDERDMV
jgi:hypothetical protein